MRGGDSDVNYAANPYGMPPERRRKRALPLPLLLTVGGVTLFAGGVVAVLSLSGGGVGVGGAPPVIEADGTPMKSRPADAGAEDAAPPDRLVYERLAGATRPSVERLLPPPEQPLPRPIVAPDPPPPPPEPVRPVVAPLPPSVQPPLVQPPANMLAPPSSPPNQHAQPNHPPPQTQTAAAKPPAAPSPAAPSPAMGTPPQTLKLPGQGGATPPLVAAPPPPKTSGGGGGWRIQLASVRSEAEAAAEWKRLSSRYAGALGGVGMQIVKADLGDKGVFYRVQGGGLDEIGARSVCEQLKSQNVGCVVVKP